MKLRFFCSLITPSLNFNGLIYSLLILISTQLLTAQNTFTSTQSGNWNDCDTWGGSNNPDHGDVVTIAAGHTVTVPEGTTFEVGRVAFAANNSRLVMDGANSRLRYTTTHLGYVAEDCCNTPQPVGVSPFELSVTGGAHTTYWQTRNVNGDVVLDYNVNGNVVTLQLTRSALPDGARFVRWISDFDGSSRLNARFLPNATDPGLTITYEVDKSPEPTIVNVMTNIYFEYTDRDGCNSYFAQANHVLSLVW